MQIMHNYRGGGGNARKPTAFQMGDEVFPARNAVSVAASAVSPIPSAVDGHSRLGENFAFYYAPNRNKMKSENTKKPSQFFRTDLFNLYLTFFGMKPFCFLGLVFTVGCCRFFLSLLGSGFLFAHGNRFRSYCALFLWVAFLADFDRSFIVLFFA